jgi:hypothetical protein
LTAAQHKAAANLYQQAAPEADAGQRPESSPGTETKTEGDVIDAEVVDEGKS